MGKGLEERVKSIYLHDRSEEVDCHCGTLKAQVGCVGVSSSKVLSPPRHLPCKVGSASARFTGPETGKKVHHRKRTICVETVENVAISPRFSLDTI